MTSAWSLILQLFYETFYMIRILSTGDERTGLVSDVVVSKCGRLSTLILQHSHHQINIIQVFRRRSLSTFLKINCLLFQWRKWLPEQDYAASLVTWATRNKLFFFNWHYSLLWALVFRTMSFHFFLPATNSLHFLTPSTWRSLSTSSFHRFLGLPPLAPSSSWVKIFLGILSSSILSRWPNQK